MNDFEELARSVVDHPPAAPPTLDALRARVRARSRRRVATVAALGCIALVAGIATVVRASDDRPDPRRVVAGPGTTQPDSPTTPSTIPAALPPPAQHLAVTLAVDPATIAPAGGKMQLTIANDTGSTIVGCDLPRLDEWNGVRWVAIGRGFDASLPPDVVPSCPAVQIPTGASDPRTATLPESGLGLYRWVLEVPVDGGQPEARFTVADEASETPGGPPPVEGSPDLAWTLEPAVVSPAGSPVRSLWENNTSEAVGFGGLCGTRFLDRWDGVGWRPLGDGTGGRPGSVGAASPEGRDCETQLRAHTRAQVLDVAPPALEPGWYRWRQLVGMPGHLVPAEARFTVRTAADPPQPLADSAVVWLAGGERLDDPRPLGTAPTQVGGTVSGLVVDERQLTLTWTTYCNQPLAVVTFDLERDAVVVRPMFAGYRVIDCVGEPSGPWTAVVDLPPLAGRKVVLVTPDGERTVQMRQSDDRLSFGPLGRDGAPAAVRPPVIVANGRISLQWHGRRCDTVTNAEMIVIEGIAYPRVSVTGPSRCPADPDGHFADGTYEVPSSFDALSVIGAPIR